MPAKTAKKPMAAKRDDFMGSVDDHVRKFSPLFQPIIQELREIIKSSAPEASEGIKWGNLTYELNGLLCYITVNKAHINFGFFKQGTKLKDPDKLLEGTGAGMRHVKIRNEDDMNVQQFKKWVKEAAEINKNSQ